MDVIVLYIAAVALLVFVGILVALAATRNPSIQDAVTEDVVAKALTGPVPIPSAHARRVAAIQQAGADHDDPEPEDEEAA